MDSPVEITVCDLRAFLPWSMSFEWKLYVFWGDVQVWRKRKSGKWYYWYILDEYLLKIFFDYIIDNSGPVWGHIGLYKGFKPLKLRTLIVKAGRLINLQR